MIKWIDIASISTQAEHRTMAAFVLAMIVEEYPNGQVSVWQNKGQLHY